MQLELRRIHGRVGVTMVYVTHDQAEALTMSDRIAVFRRGAIEQLADPRTLYDAPANAFVAQFIGENNRLPGAVLSTEGGVANIRLAAGPVVAARDAGCGPAGSACVVTIRPERIAVAEVAGERAIAARLTEAIFLGDHVRLRFAVGDAEVTVKRPAAAGFGALQPGDMAALAWEPRHAAAYCVESALP